MSTTNASQSTAGSSSTTSGSASTTNSSTTVPSTTNGSNSGTASNNGTNDSSSASTSTVSGSTSGTTSTNSSSGTTGSTNTIDATTQQQLDKFSTTLDTFIVDQLPQAVLKTNAIYFQMLRLYLTTSDVFSNITPSTKPYPWQLAVITYLNKAQGTTLPTIDVIVKNLKNIARNGALNKPYTPKPPAPTPTPTPAVKSSEKSESSESKASAKAAK